jgi:cyclohexa-1,5-dienecarbonyl-CoA hydratase
MEKIKVSYSHENSIAKVVLDDGKGNVLDAVMMGELIELFEKFKSNNNLKLITFEGAGKHFSFGASVEEHTKGKCGAMLSSFHKMFYALIEMGIPTAAIVSGQCLGGGFELAMACNFIFADETAVFGQPEIMLGVFAPPSSIILPMKIGSARAEDFLITGRSVESEYARKLGLVNKIYKNRVGMNSGVSEWAEKHILGKSASSLKFANRASRVIFNERLMNYLPVLEKFYNDELMNTHDANEGINSFIEKRKPEWKNK